MRKSKKQLFQDAVARGRRFEGEEKAGWEDIRDGKPCFEHTTSWQGKGGRIDIRVDETGGFVSVVEIKATNWDRIAPGRIRPNALRHARQVWRYIYAELKNGLQVCP